MSQATAKLPALADSLRDWALHKTGCAPLAEALARAMAAETEGHACAELDDAGLDLDALRDHPWVGKGRQRTPLVLTVDGRAFLWRNWAHEARIAEALRERVGVEGDLDTAAEADLGLLFTDIEPVPAQRQIEAVRAIVGRRLLVLSGGPGTGKTTTVLRMLLMRQRIAQREGRLLSMALAAPTGKAAQRLSQAVRDGITALQASLARADEDWQAALATLPASAQTLHRLLGAQPRLDRFRHGRENPLPHDMVVVDEASMVDLGLMRALVDALGPETTLVLVGDPDQLVSVSAGSVLADIVSAAEAGALPGHHVRLEHIWRAGGRLGEVYEAVRRADSAVLLGPLDTGLPLARHAVADRTTLQKRITAWLALKQWDEIHALADDPATPPDQLFAELRQLQLLTAQRSGPWGSDEINAAIDQRMRRRYGDTVWHPGRPVIVRHNDYTRRVFNGDVGITAQTAEGMRVCFEHTDSEGRGDYRWLLPQELPEHDLGYALTIHKSQGSEYHHVALLLPPDASSRILSRQLLYTGVSRAKISLELWATDAALEAALTHPIERLGGLRERLGGRQTDGTDGVGIGS